MFILIIYKLHNYPFIIKHLHINKKNLLVIYIYFIFIIYIILHYNIIHSHYLYSKGDPNFTQS